MRVWVAHAEADAGVASVLRRLVEFHGLKAVTLPARGPAPEAAGSGVLLLLCSEKAAREGGFRELASQYRQGGGGREIVVVWLGGGPAANALPGLSAYPSVSFSESGLTDLFRLLGCCFLEHSFPQTASRPAVQRRVVDRRSGPRDRRTWNLRRFRTGLWLAFERISGCGKFDLFPLSVNNEAKMREALHPELNAYIYTDAETGGHPLPSDILVEAVQHVWRKHRERQLPAVHVTELIAEYLWDRYAPQPVDRRLGIERRAEGP